MDTKEICVCSHKKEKHFAVLDSSRLPCLSCDCGAFRPAPSQPSRTGFELDNGTSGTVANTHYPPEVRDEKIARIVKEFEENGWQKGMRAGKDTPFAGELMIDMESAKAWLTQTLTTLLNEE
jgi:hypothetical protein